MTKLDVFMGMNSHPEYDLAVFQPSPRELESSASSDAQPEHAVSGQREAAAQVMAGIRQQVDRVRR